MNPIGRTTIANVMLFSRARYIVSHISAPKWFHEALESDARSLIWSGTRDLDKEEVGSSNAHGYWLPNDEIHGSKSTGLGLGLINWTPHV